MAGKKKAKPLYRTPRLISFADRIQSARGDCYVGNGDASVCGTGSSASTAGCSEGNFAYNLCSIGNDIEYT